MKIVTIVLFIGTLVCAADSSLTPESFIEGGISATPGEFPYLVSIYAIDNVKDKYFPGVILSKATIATSARSVDKFLNFGVVAGAQNPKMPESTQQGQTSSFTLDLIKI